MEEGGHVKVPRYPSAVGLALPEKKDSNTLEIAVILDDER